MLLIGLMYFIFKVRWDLHMFQQNSYRPERYLHWMNQTHQPIIKKSDWMFILGSMISLLPSLTCNPWITAIGFILGLPFMALSIMMFHVKITWQPAKKKLAWTPRVKRMLITTFVWLNLLYAFAFVSRGVWFIWVAIVFSIVYSWAFVLCGNLTNSPIEALINHRYYADAQRRLKMNPNLIVIGVTGSYGKTSVKNVLFQLLSQKYNVLMTPESYNTPMGVIRTIRERLNPTHEIFIVEMGAKEIGDITEICNLVHPRMGIISSIGPQHLDTFKTLENVIRTKGELFDNVQEGGTLFVNLNDENIRTLTLRTDVKAIRFGNAQEKNTNYAVNNVQITDDGTLFTLLSRFSDTSRTSDEHSKDKGKNSHKGKNKAPSAPKPMPYTQTELKTKLLGAHNIDNILGSIAIAMELGLSATQINRALFDLYPVKHRLSYSKSGLGYTILDDAFNSNPTGSKNALEVLKQIKGNRKIILTPGMIELGDQQFELNEKFGEYMANACDYVVLVGKKQTLPIQQGLKNKHFPDEKCLVVQNLAEGFKAINAYAKPGDVLLIENDLPDSFNE
jgi:UDP-N-acetylmuramoyl-tripeptide--D-alanyl-D-alanine ligase